MRSLDLAQHLLRYRGKRRVRLEIWNIRDVTPVFIAEEDVDVMVCQIFTPSNWIIPLPDPKKPADLIWLYLDLDVLHVQPLVHL